MVAVDADSETADELLAALFGSVGFVGEEDEASASAPHRFLLDSIESGKWLEKAKRAKRSGTVGLT